MTKIIKTTKELPQKMQFGEAFYIDIEDLRPMEEGEDPAAFEKRIKKGDKAMARMDAAIAKIKIEGC